MFQRHGTFQYTSVQGPVSVEIPDNKKDGMSNMVFYKVFFL